MESQTRLAGIRLIAFDLDNTIYDEGLYFTGAFKVIAPVLAAKARCGPRSIEERLQGVLRDKGRHYHHLFDDVLAELGLDPRVELAEVLNLFRTVEPHLEPFPGTRELLEDLRSHYRLGMITSGMRAVQENKVRLLDIAGYFEEIVYSSALAENKPGRLPFRLLLDTLGVEAGAAAYVGDNPLLDFRGANELGMITVRVYNPEFEGTEVEPGCDGRIKVRRVTDLRSLFLR